MRFFIFHQVACSLQLEDAIGKDMMDYHAVEHVDIEESSALQNEISSITCSQEVVICQNLVEALKSIARALNKTSWDFSVDPCSQELSWVTPNALVGYENSVWCNNCSEDGSVCHVTSIVLKSQNLVGMLPPEMAKFPFLQEIDLTRNYIYGSIPKEWAVLPLVNFSLLGNRISGQIPSWIGNFTNLRNLLLSSNFLSGELPDTFANLTNLKYFLIRSNNFNGKIPQFIQNWTQLLRLDLQASGLQGPIPSGISRLKKLDDLRISDIIGNSGFPQLQGIEQLQYLDLSFNKLSGNISTTFQSLLHTNVMFLTGNNLSGLVPYWMLLSKNNMNERVPCLEAIPCAGYQWSLNINCGGDQVTTNDNLIYESDNDGSDGVSTFRVGTNWAVSSTGAFLDLGDNNNFITTTRQNLSMPDSEFVKLHFAEIIIIDYNGYSSPGRRIFDVYIQGELVLKDFNIKVEANGSDKAVVKKFNAIVTKNKLEIRFYWAGKGTTNIPTSGTYGPLISAISVAPSKFQASKKKQKACHSGSGNPRFSTLSNYLSFLCNLEERLFQEK
ncbi:hypothetical protein IEQ34_021605 [Dendrobium chrysotoxum]|uniref:non-specific serine/threonine protein kinase n=1 Tax=Dendrobium chrysotoxum TaxID=161865 RepID=A0AAV7G581_DENCH|nr:hypothetical protein IEQ34_021605 [Dendrobium chrysotoxum]